MATSLQELAEAASQRCLWPRRRRRIPTTETALYVEQLIGPDTVNTMPPETIDAFLDHDRVQSSCEVTAKVRATDPRLVSISWREETSA
jgi:transaldolase